MAQQGRALTDLEIGRICALLRTDLPIKVIAIRTGNTPACIQKINCKFEIRSYNGKRTEWSMQGQEINVSLYK